MAHPLEGEVGGGVDVNNGGSETKGGKSEVNRHMKMNNPLEKNLKGKKSFPGGSESTEMEKERTVGGAQAKNQVWRTIDKLQGR